MLGLNNFLVQKSCVCVAVLIAEEKLENIQDLILQLQRLESELEDGFEVELDGVSYVFCPQFIDRLDRFIIEQMRVVTHLYDLWMENIFYASLAKF